MVTQENLIRYFRNLTVPSHLLALLKFENEIGQTNSFSCGFEFYLDDEKLGLKTYSFDEEFLNSIYEFAMADGSGSSYGFWVRDENTELNQAPIVVFGSEGGYHVVARNFNELLQILSFDGEPSIDWDEVYYYKDPDDSEPSDKSEEYRHWLRAECSLDPVDDADSIVKQAQEEHGASFKSWVGRFYER